MGTQRGSNEANNGPTTGDCQTASLLKRDKPTSIANNSDLYLASLNIGRGFHSKEEELMEFLKDQQIDILGMQEVDFKNLDDRYLPGINGYQSFFTQHKATGGKVRVMVMVKDSLMPYTTLRTDLMSTNAQTVWLQIELPKQSLDLFIANGLTRGDRGKQCCH